MSTSCKDICLNEEKLFYEFNKSVKGHGIYDS